MSRMLLRGLLFLLALSVSALTRAGLSYVVALPGAEEQEAFLRQKLDIVNWQTHELLNEALLDRLYANTPENIRELLATEGYFSPQITAFIDKQTQPWLIRFTIQRGMQARVGRVNLTSENQDPALLQRLQTQWPLKSGMKFRQSEWRNAKKQLLDTLTAEDYPQADIQRAQAEVSSDGQTVDLSLQLTTGPQTRFGELFITGLERVPREAVSHLNQIKPGEPYRREALTEYQMRLQDSGYFSSVLVEAKPNADAPEIADLHVQLSEAPRQKVRFGLGYSTDSYTRTQLSYEHHNIANRGWYFNGLLKADGYSQGATEELSFPADPRGYVHTLGHSYEHRTLTDGDNFVNRLYARRRWGSTREEQNLTVELQDDRTYTGVDNLLKEVISLATKFGWTRRGVDDLIFPSRGLMSDYSLALGASDTVTGFAQAKLRQSHYARLRQRWLWHGQLEWGHTFGDPRNIPTDYLFRAGGDNSVRGYAFNSLGIQSDNGSTGAQSLLLASAEMQYWFLEHWGTAFFFDAGGLGRKPWAADWYPGYGAGLRWRSPVGPLHLDIAKGSRSPDAYQIHFAIGVAF